MVVACWLLGVDCCSLGVARWALCVGCCMLVVVCWFLGAGCWLLAVGCWVLLVCCLVLAVGWCHCPVDRRSLIPMFCRLRFFSVDRGAGGASLSRLKQQSVD